MPRFPAFLMFCLAMAPCPALSAEQSLSGEDAAYIDWGVKNCEVTSTDKEHRQVEQATAKSRDTFMKQYMGKNLSDALASPSKQEAMCKDIKSWYGPQGSRIADLITWRTAAAAAPDKAAATTATRKGRHRSSQ